MNRQVTSQHHQMTTSSSGGSQVVNESSYQVQQQTYQQQYSGQQPVRMHQQYQVQQQQSSNQGAFGQPGQHQRVFQDSSASTKSQEFIRSGHQPMSSVQHQPQNQTFMNQAQTNQQSFQRPTQDSHVQNKAFMNQSPAGQQSFQREQQQYHPQNQAFSNQSPTNQQQSQTNYSNQPQPFAQQQNTQSIPQQQADQAFPRQGEEEFLKKPSKLIHQWPPQPTEEVQKQPLETGGQGLISWPPQQEPDDTNKVEFEPKPLDQHYVGMPNKTAQPQQFMRNDQQPSSQKHVQQTSQQYQTPPRNLSGYSQKQPGAESTKGFMGSPMVGGTGQVDVVPQVAGIGLKSNIPQGPRVGQGQTPFQGGYDTGLDYGQGPNAPQGPNYGQRHIAPQGPGYVQGPMTPQRPGYGHGPTAPQRTGYGQGSTTPQGSGYDQGSTTTQGPGYEQGPKTYTTPQGSRVKGSNPQGSEPMQGFNRPPGPGFDHQRPNISQGTAYGQGIPRTQGHPLPQEQVAKHTASGTGVQQPSQSQQNPEAHENEPITLPRGNIQDQKNLFEKPHSYDPTQCDVGGPYGDGNLPEWPPKVAGGPNMTMTYPSAFKLRDEAPIDHQTMPLSAPSQPAFKLTTPIRKKGDEVWPPKGSFSDEPSTDVRDFAKPTKANKTYDSFFAANMLPNNYPGYKAPPGTQHVGYMDDAQPL